MFGVNLMVHSWVKNSTSSIGSMSDTSASFKSVRATDGQRASAPSNWIMARSIFFLIAFLVLFSGFTLVHTFASTGEVTPATSNEIVISVDSGDTLWQLAKTYKKNAMDTREAVRFLQKRNGLASSEVKPGQMLIIPVRMLP
jgi:LysM repeat protein